jgi:hypothetical protein
MEPIKLFWTFELGVGFQCVVIALGLCFGWSGLHSWWTRRAMDRSTKAFQAEQLEEGIRWMGISVRRSGVDHWVGLLLIPVVLFLSAYGVWYEWTHAEPGAPLRNFRDWCGCVIFGPLMVLYLGSNSYRGFRDARRDRRGARRGVEHGDRP